MMNVTIKNAMTEEQLTALENTIKEKRNANKKAYANKKSYIDDSKWDEYDSLKNGDGDALNDLLTRTIINKGYSTVRMYRKAIQNPKFTATESDYRIVNNIAYVMDNLSHVVADTYIRIETTYRYKYSESVYHAVRACAFNSIDHCKRDDFSNASALYTVNSDGEERCIIDTDNESAREYEINTESVAIAKAEFSRASELVQFIIKMKYEYNDSFATIANKAYLHGITENKVSGQYINKVYNKWIEQFK